MKEKTNKCGCYTHKGTPCTRVAKYRAIRVHDNSVMYFCETHVKPYLDKYRAAFYEIKDLEKL